MRLKSIILLLLLFISSAVIGQRSNSTMVRSWPTVYVPGEVIKFNIFSNDSVCNVRCNDINAKKEGNYWIFKLGPDVSTVNVYAEVYNEGLRQQFDTILPIRCSNSSYILSVGTGDNPIKGAVLTHSPDDAKRVHDTLYSIILTQFEGKTLLNDCDANSNAIIKAFKAIEDSLVKYGGEGKKVFVYLSGHGEQKDGFSFQVKSDDTCVDSDYICRDILTECFKGITKTEAHIWVFLDACEANWLSSNWSDDTFENGCVFCFPANKQHESPVDGVFANAIVSTLEELKNEQVVSAQLVYNTINKNMGESLSKFVVQGNNGYTNATDELVFLRGDPEYNIAPTNPPKLSLDISVGFQFSMQGPYVRLGSTIRNKWHWFVEIQPTISSFQKENDKYNVGFVGINEKRYRPSSLFYDCFGGVGIGFRRTNSINWGLDLEVRFGGLLSEAVIKTENIYGENNSWITTTTITPPIYEPVIGVAPVFFIRPLPHKLNQLYLELGYSFDFGINSKQLCAPALGQAFSMGVGYSFTITR